MIIRMASGPDEAAIKRWRKLWRSDSKGTAMYSTLTFLVSLITLSHTAVMRELSDVIADGNILQLVEKFLKAGVMEGGKVRPTRVGTPQGGVASPLLANIALNVLDWHLHNHGFRFVRYADDFVVLCKTEHEAKEALALVEHLLADQLGLALSPEKTKISRFHEGFTFLGFDIKSRFVRMRAKSDWRTSKPRCERLPDAVTTWTPR